MINKLQVRALRIISDDQKSNFQDLISKCKEYTIHQRNLQILIIEKYKIINDIASPIRNSFFLSRENVHNIWNFQILSYSTKETLRCGLETPSDRSPFSWANSPQECKSQTSLCGFKEKIRKWIVEICDSWLCKHYKENLGKFYWKNLDRKLSIIISSIININFYISYFTFFVLHMSGLLIIFTMCCKCIITSIFISSFR